MAAGDLANVGVPPWIGVTCIPSGPRVPSDIAAAAIESREDLSQDLDDLIAQGTVEIDSQTLAELNAIADHAIEDPLVFLFYLFVYISARLFLLGDFC